MRIQRIDASQNPDEGTLSLIKEFWWQHSQVRVRDQDCVEEYQDWTGEGHLFYLFLLEQQVIGFAHLASRGVNIDWLEHLFILPQFQQQGYGRQGLKLLEEEVKASSRSLYIEVAARNQKALRFYHQAGYDCLNTVTIRKDFHKEDFEVVNKEHLQELDFEVRKRKEP